ncbi:hypothetical protein L7F22_022001 [Adiantum nelumboides]|nr:hypothetical protein [Adiantum nelumboides]
MSFKMYLDDIPSKFPPIRGQDDHTIELLPRSSPPNKPLYKVPHAQQEKILRQVNELVEKSMVRFSSSPLCSPILLVQKKYGYSSFRPYYLSSRDCMDPKKLEVRNEWPIPSNLHELRSFIGMCADYRCFIEKLSLIAGPSQDLTKRKVKFVWTAKENEAFKSLEAKLICQLVLILPDLSKPFEVQCDDCGHCLGAVLLQEGHDIAYESIYENELLAIMHALDSWRHYLLGTPFILSTDHQSLKYFLTQTKLSDKQTRWANFLFQFISFNAHIVGKQNQVADALSE